MTTDGTVEYDDFGQLKSYPRLARQVAKAIENYDGDADRAAEAYIDAYSDLRDGHEMEAEAACHGALAVLTLRLF